VNVVSGDPDGLLEDLNADGQVLLGKLCDFSVKRHEGQWEEEKKVNSNWEKKNGEKKEKKKLP